MLSWRHVRLLSRARKIVPAAMVLCLAISFCFVASAIFRQRRAFVFGRVIKQPSLARFPKDYRAEIAAAKAFAERYVGSYLEFLNKEIRPELRNSFMLANKEGISAKLILSSVAESCLALYPAGKSELTVECTKYPVQMALLTRLETSNPAATLKVPYEEAISNYEQAKAGIRFKDENKIHRVSNLQFKVHGPRVFSFAKDNLAILARCGFVLTDGKGHEASMDLGPVAIMTGNADFSFALGKAGELGKELAASETIGLIVSSPFFRDLFAYDKLRPLAEDIQSKQSRAEKDHGFQYPFPLAKRDIQTLQLLAAKVGLDASYIDNLLKDVSANPDDGYLFWYYRNRAGFTLQWASANVVLLLVIGVFLAVRRRVARINWRPIRLLVVFLKSSVILGINGYIFSHKPESLHVLYMAIPALCFVAALALSLWATSDNKPKDANGKGGLKGLKGQPLN